MVAKCDINIKFDAHIPEKEEWLTNSLLLQPNYAVCCITNGSVKNCKSGIGVYIGATNCKLSLQLSLQLGKYLTVIQTEIVAVMTAAQTLHHSGLEG